MKLEIPPGGIIVDFTYSLDIHPKVFLNLGCKLPAGVVFFEHDPGRNPYIKLGFYPSIEGLLKVSIKATLHEYNAGHFYLLFISDLTIILAIFGTWVAWISLLIDILISTVISSNIPELVREGVTKAMASAEWTLIDIKPIVPTPTKLLTTVEYDFSNTHAVVSIDYLKGN